MKKVMIVSELKYQELFDQAQAEIGRIKNQLRAALSKREQELQNLREELSSLGARLKVGQLEEQDYQRRRQRVLTAITRKEEEISNLQKLLEANSSAEAGGSVEVKIRPAREVPLMMLPEIRLPEFASLGQVFYPLRIAGFLVSLLMLIFVFLPWVSVDYVDLSFEFKAMEAISDQENKVREFNGGGILALLAGILGMGSSLAFAKSSSRAIAYLVSGALGIAGIITFSVIFGTSYNNTLNQLEEFGENGLSFAPKIGGILFVITLSCIFIVSYLELKQEK